MKKRLISVFAFLSVALSPFAFGIAAGGAAEWTELSASKTWQYDGYQVERLSESSGTLLRIGDALVLVKRAAACSGSCDLRDIKILSEGGSRTVSNIQTSALDSNQIKKNENRLVYAEFSNESKTRINVIEVDLTSGQKITLVEDAFLTDTDEVLITVDGERVYAEAKIDHSSANDLEPQSTIFAWNPRYDKFMQLYHQWKLRYEEILDAEGDRVLIRMTFPGGEEQLWVYNYVEFGEQEGTAVPDTWTPDVEDIAVGHFASDDDIEFFRMYARNVADESLDQTKTYEQYLSWYRDYNKNDLSNIVQMMGETLAWIDPDNNLYVSDGEDVNKIAYLGGSGSFELLDGYILWDNGSTGGISTSAGLAVKSFTYKPTDMIENIVVGVGTDGTIYYTNLKSGTAMTLGEGNSPMISDERHIYWRGNDGYFYEATISLEKTANVVSGTPIKTASSVKVYMLEGNTISYIPNEQIYYTWFESFKNVVTVSESQLASYDLGEDILWRPGTRIRMNDGSKIFVIGSDKKIHWLVSEEIAKSLFGSEWNKDVLSLTSYSLVDYDYGDHIYTEDDLAKAIVSR